MTVTTRNTHGATLLGRRRTGRSAWTTRSREASAPGRTDPTTDERAATAARLRRRLDAPQDHATYTCDCGFVFEAEVSTSVGCPHCGVAQAW